MGRMPVNGGWMPPSSSAAPDYIGCLSQMSNSFLSSADDAAGGPGVGGTPAGGGSGPGRQNSAGGGTTDHAASLPPTPVGSQLSGSQICTPLDGQSLHPRTPSDATVAAVSGSSSSSSHPPLTPQDPSSQPQAPQHRLSTESATTGGPPTPSHVRQRQTSVAATTATTSEGGGGGDGVGDASTSRDGVENAQNGVDAGGLPPLLTGSDANVAEALEVHRSTTPGLFSISLQCFNAVGCAGWVTGRTSGL